MPRKNSRTTRRVKVSPEVRAIAALVAARATRVEDAPTRYLTGRVFGSRIITRVMWRRLRAEAV